MEPLIRLDMSEFMEKHSVSRIIGSPPGYVGYDEAGQLTEKVRRRPYSIVLFDEIEKAHPDVMNILLQILDEGRITDAQGRQVSFENTIIIMTSNAGSERQGSALGFDKTRYDDAKDKAETSLRQFLRPEFLARVDEVVVFRPLTEADMQKIAALMLEELKKGLAEREIKFGWDEGVLRLAAAEAYGHKSGAPGPAECAAAPGGGPHLHAAGGLPRTAACADPCGGKGRGDRAGDSVRRRPNGQNETDRGADSGGADRAERGELFILPAVNKRGSPPCPGWVRGSLLPVGGRAGRRPRRAAPPAGSAR